MICGDIPTYESMFGWMGGCLGGLMGGCLGGLMGG